ncbi:AraC family transcriptional regulator [Bacillota bacterium Meth-B3]|nr:AraC family transcriptional regulator [Christensenellaceae bacterium]MEA5065209.1 AraC family transcriptional regulator [Eubacteriales bacterium]
MEIYWSGDSADKDVFVRQCGSEACARGHMYGPAVRDHFLIHYVASGTGVFWADDRTHHIFAKQGFIIFPGQEATYRADDDDPWRYAWVGYDGRNASTLTETIGLTRDNPVFDLDAEIDPYERIRRMLRAASEMRLGDMAMLGALYQLLSEIGQGRASLNEELEKRYYKKAVWYLEGNYHGDVRVTDVAAFVGLSRSQLFRVFQRVDGRSPKEYLNMLRIERAAKLLRATDLPLEEVATSAGFFSAGRLNAVFRAQYGASPNQYRKSIREAGDDAARKSLNVSATSTESPTAASDISPAGRSACRPTAPTCSRSNTR